MLPPLPCYQTSVAIAGVAAAYHACSRTPSSAVIQRSSTPSGGGGTKASGKKMS